MDKIAKHFKGEFLLPALEIANRLDSIRAFLFDWDGVFNDGEKNRAGSSSFGELDAMGTNLLRFNHYLRNKVVPPAGIVTGEKNEICLAFAERESFQAVYYSVKNKINALRHFCSNYHVEPKQICFFFDDVLDLSITPEVGLRIMIGSRATPLLRDYVKRNSLADYITEQPGGNSGLREAIEMFIGLSGRYDETVHERVLFSEVYKTYLQQRNTSHPEIFTADASLNIIHQS